MELTWVMGGWWFDGVGRPVVLTRSWDTGISDTLFLMRIKCANIREWR